MVSAPRTYAFHVLFACALVGVIFAHTYRMATLPCGLYQDEAGVGGAAHDIQATLHDGDEFLPLYFRSVGTGVAPVYVYTLAGMIRLFGASEFTLRLTAACFHFAFIGVLLLLLARLVPAAGRKFALLFALVAAGFFPWLFSVSRYAHEINSQPLLFLLAFFFVYRAFEERREGSSPESGVPWRAIVAGLFCGLSIYSYATARLFTLVLGPLVLVAYFRGTSPRRLIAFGGACALALLPFLSDALIGGHAVTHRLGSVSYVFADLPLMEKAFMFLERYFGYFGPGNLFASGDPNPRHAIGFTGQVLPATLVVGLVGLVVAWWRLPRRFHFVLLCMLLLAPVGGALALNKLHALRGLLLPVFFLVYVGVGAAFLYERVGQRWRLPVAAVLLLWTLHGSAGYLRTYFEDYPGRSVLAFESWGVDPLIRQALETGPTRIDFLTDEIDYTVTSQMRFYRAKYAIPEAVAMERLPASRGIPGTCELTHLPREERMRRTLRNLKGCGPENYQYALKCF